MSSSVSSTSFTLTLSSSTDSVPSTTSEISVPPMSSSSSSSSSLTSVSPSSSVSSADTASTTASFSETNSESSSSLSIESPSSPSPTSSTESSETISASSQESTSSSSTPPPPPPPPPTHSFMPSSTTTLSTTAFVTTTDRLGHTTTSAPAEVTAILITMGNNGQLVTVTVVQVNPTLSVDENTSSTPAFFRNSGAVAGVFLLVGLATTSIILWIFFAVRRRRRQFHHDSGPKTPPLRADAIIQHAPFGNEDDAPHPDPRNSQYGSPKMAHRSSSGFAINTISSLPSAARTSGYLDSPNHVSQDTFNPYLDFSDTSPPTAVDYSAPRASSSTNLANYRDRMSTGSGGDRLISHSASGSNEPLLSSYYKWPTSDMHALPTQTPPTPPPWNPQRISDAAKSSLPTQSETLSRSRSTRASTDDRLDPILRKKLERNTEPQDNEDYSRPVLAVRNGHDGKSLASHQS